MESGLETAPTLSSAATCSSVSRVRAASTTFAPTAAKAVAIALPMPLDAPVITTTLPSGSAISLGRLEENHVHLTKRIKIFGRTSKTPPASNYLRGMPRA